MCIYILSVFLEQELHCDFSLVQTGDMKRRPGNRIEGATGSQAGADNCALYSISWTTFHIPSLYTG